jgi:ATP-dependent Clp protease ATP-binding subunit ClpX
VPPSKEERLALVPSPKSIVTHLDQSVFGQDVAKRRIAVGVSNHFRWVVVAWYQGAADPIVTNPDLRDVRIQKSNFLPIGPSGSGITHLFGLLASYVDLPLVIGDATSPGGSGR